MKIIRPSLKPDLCCKKIGLNLAIFGRNEGNFRKKDYVSVDIKF